MFSVYFASDRSSSGKSTITMAFSMMLKDSGYSLNIYKTGPDFIDPVILSKALNLDVKNLDPFLIPDKYLKEWFFGENSNDNDNGGCGNWNLCQKKAFVVESAMGLYDGNSYEIAKRFKFPVVLVMDSKRISSTMASLVYGLKNYKKGVRVCGVILNNISSARHYEIISGEIKKNIPDIEVFGYILNDESVFSIKERHLGLVTPDFEPDGNGKEFAKTAEGIKKAVFKNIDSGLMIKTLEKKSQSFSRLFFDYSKIKPGILNKNNKSKNGANSDSKKRNTGCDGKPKIAVALDKAFFFYYNFNFEILKSFGAEIIFFSPLKDRALPRGTKAIYIGGGYPEIYAAGLAANEDIRKEIYKFSKNNGIIYAECGGLMYLCKKIAYNRQSFDMAGVFPFSASMDNARLSLGYRTVRLKEKTFLGEAGLTANGHEFHYSKIAKDDCVGNDNKNIKNVLEYESISTPGIFKPEGYNILNTVGSYIHLSFYSNKLLAKNLVGSAGKF
ncbi:MAG: cobyrinate a,c-diamide synthase [bacterium]